MCALRVECVHLGLNVCIEGRMCALRVECVH